ncbi:transporter substrate-binding domain-containing protein [Marinobacter halodurans]|uniref:Transporter substrate-binding domain-containing protein n=1 Tax=Marinobacter halodurans TaxID=2528979 RepID=A0ABY1ZNE9_9GAMM|nr:transporter substrate-binding domain-containing protein [Marinobacter halodurans]TBW57962.1 transporter substrate-binding domain-containing protein [Marinobacter halodurans]
MLHPVLRSHVHQKLIGPATLLVMLWSISLEAETVRLTNGDWPPYLSEKPPYGFVSDIIRRAFAVEGIDVEWGFFPWSRSYILARDGHWDGTAAWSCSPERAASFYYSAPITPIRYVFFHRVDRDFDWHHADDLRGLRVGLTQDYFYGEVIEQARAQGWIDADTTTSDPVNFRKLLAGRIDLFPIDARAGLRILQQNFTPEEARQITYHPRVLHAAYLHLLLTRALPANRGRMAAFNDGLQHLRAEGLAALQPALEPLPRPLEENTAEVPRHCPFNAPPGQP